MNNTYAISKGKKSLVTFLKRNILFKMIQYSVIAIALVMVILPLLFLISTSIKPSLEVYNNVSLIPSRIIWDNFANVLSPEKETVRYLTNSVLITLISTLLSIFIGSFAAYALNRLGYTKVAAIITTVIVVVRFYPKITVVLPYFLLMKYVGMLDKLAGIILSHVSITIPFTVMIMMTFYAEIPKEIEESAFVDGSDVFSTYLRIVIPITTTGMAATAILISMISWNEFLMASSIASSEAVTLPILISGFITDKGTDWGAMSALSIICMVPIILLVLFTQRYLVRGLTAGAVKG